MLLTSGCTEEREPLAAPFVTIALDLASIWDQGVFCVSPYEWYSNERRHPAKVLEGIVQEGFQLVDWIEEPLDTSVNALTLSPIIRDSAGLRVSAQVAEFYINDGKVCGGSTDWTYVLDCDGPNCTILNRSGPGGSTYSCDSTRATTKEVLAGEGQRCPKDGG